MNEPRERLFWVIAVTLSITAHIAFVLLMPGVIVKPDIKPIIRVRLAMAEKESAPALASIRKDTPAEEKAVPKKETVPKNKPQKIPEPQKRTKTPSENILPREVSTAADIQTSPAESQVNAKSDVAAADSPQVPLSKPQPQKIFELDSLEVVKKVLPDYSSFSRKRKEEGTVKIIATVTDGRVVRAEVEISSGFQRLDESALRAVRQWLFKNNGTVRVRVPVTFRLK